MTQPQKGLCAEPNLHAQYLLLNVIDDDSQAVRAKLSRVLDIFEHFENEHYEAMVTGVVAIGTGYWAEVYPGLIPVELALFLICSVMIEVPPPCLAISSFKFALIGWIFAMRLALK